MKRDVRKRESLARVKLSDKQLESSRKVWQESTRGRLLTFSAWVRERIGANKYE